MKIVLFLSLLFAASIESLQGQANLSIEDAGTFSLSSGGTGAGDLSGLTWAGGDLFYTVSDSDHTIYPVTVTLNRTTGYPTAAVLGSSLLLDAGSDTEGAAFNRGNESVYVSDETGPAVREHFVIDGSLQQTLPMAQVYFNIRPNFSLESLTLQSGHRALWTANEEALNGDGPLSTVGQGTVVRLQLYTSDLQLAGQWAYVTDGITNLSPFIDEERSGVSDLAVLPDGRLLVLERELGGVGFLLFPEFRSRIYEVDFTGATDVSGLSQLEGATYTPVGKTLLWESTFALNNFEGMALGRQLDDGSHSLLLISDDGSGLLQSLQALRLYGAGPWLSQDPLLRGSDVDFVAVNLDPGDRAFFLYSFSGPGTGQRIPQLGGLPLDLLPPVRIFGDAVADSSGRATLTFFIPSGAPLISMATQAVVQRGHGGVDSVKSNAVSDQIQP